MKKPKITKIPNATLRKPAPAEKTGLMSDDNFPPKTDGTLSAEAIRLIANIKPAPKNTMKKTPSITPVIVDMAKMTRAPLPARPCTIPTENGR